MSQEELQILRELDCPEEPRIRKKKTPRIAVRDAEEDDQEQ